MCRCWRTLAEIDQTLELLARQGPLDADGLAYDPGIKVGAMIEIPAPPC
ncbi:hypothetical protein ACU4HD_47035 [Cupriavidus basilensis]